MSTNKNLS